MLACCTMSSLWGDFREEDPWLLVISCSILVQMQCISVIAVRQLVISLCLVPHPRSIFVYLYFKSKAQQQYKLLEIFSHIFLCFILSIFPWTGILNRCNSKAGSYSCDLPVVSGQGKYIFGRPLSVFTSSPAKFITNVLPYPYLSEAHLWKIIYGRKMHLVRKFWKNLKHMVFVNLSKWVNWIIPSWTAKQTDKRGFFPFCYFVSQF